MEVPFGTTCSAFKIRLGVVVALDSLCRSAPIVGADGLQTAPGQILTHTYNKMFEMNLGLICALTGSLANAESYLRITRTEWRKADSWYNNTMTPEEVAQFLHEYIEKVKNFNAPFNHVNLMVAGLDRNKVPSLWETNGNEYLPHDRTSIGTGANRANEILFGQNSTYNYEMSKDAATELGQRIICHAGIHDPGTGGRVKVFLVGDGILQLLSDDDYLDLRNKYYPQHPMDPSMEIDSVGGVSQRSLILENL